MVLKKQVQELNIKEIKKILQKGDELELKRFILRNFDQFPKTVQKEFIFYFFKENLKKETMLDLKKIDQEYNTTKGVYQILKRTVSEAAKKNN